MSIDSKFNQRENLGTMLSQILGKGSEGDSPRPGLVDRLFVRPASRGRRKGMTRPQRATPDELTFTRARVSIGGKKQTWLSIGDTAGCVASIKRELQAVYGNLGIETKIVRAEALTESQLLAAGGRSIESQLRGDERRWYIEEIVSKRQFEQQQAAERRRKRDNV